MDGTVHLGRFLMAPDQAGAFGAGVAVAHFRNKLEEIGAIYLGRFSRRVARCMEAFRLFKDIWRNGPRYNHMCAMCHTVRRGTDFCDS